MGYFVAFLGAAQQRSAGRKAEAIGEANARRESEEAAEATRRLKLEQEKVLSETRARAAASGVTSEGTVEAYLGEMEKNFSDELDWIKKSGASAANIQRRQGAYQRQQADAQAWGTIANAFSREF